MNEPSTVEKGGSGFEGIRLLLCENPLPPIEEAIVAARAELPRSNHYTEPYSEPLRELLSDQHDVPIRHIHVDAGSELILRQLFDRFGQQVHLLTPTYPLFPEIAEQYTETRLQPEDDFQFDLGDLEVPSGTTLVVLVDPNNPNGGSFDMDPLPDLLEAYPETRFLVDEAFGEFVDESVVDLVPQYDNLLVTRTLSKAHSLAGFRVGYAVLPGSLAADLNASNDAYPLRLPPVETEPGGGSRDPPQRIQDSGPHREVTLVDRAVGRRPPVAGRSDLPDGDVLLPRGLQPPRREPRGGTAAKKRHLRQTARRRASRPGVHAGDHGPPSGQRTGRRRAGGDTVATGTVVAPADQSPTVEPWLAQAAVLDAPTPSGSRSSWSRMAM
ncbi:aminotransferase class I/II-fold pyridoxal phosphate-dependent enzyme [Haloarchaeobius sp. HRN-SO-5]|uniref:aminotransferase class I/II-fold pyridoxal phosphate-dependent enzyme n=1 Tax=Haloarchaeobius sp. HRN-SO-5 TaxID=3446118 RepID=UPI003EB81C38